MKFILVIATFAAIAMGVGLLGNRSEPKRNPDIYNQGSSTVYNRIASLTDCSELQREFDQAEENRSISGDPSIQTSYMEAADNRMRELGCYG